MGKKSKSVRPDDYFELGPFQIARFGKNTTFRANRGGGEFEKFQDALVERFPEVVSEIDELVIQISELVRKLPPAKILQQAWLTYTVMHIGVKSESEADPEAPTALRMLDYLQSVVASVEPAETVHEEVSEENWQSLHEMVETLFSKINREYQMCRTAVKQRNNPDFDVEYEEFYLQAETLWCNIRGDRYLYHQIAHFRELIDPHNDVLIELFDLTANDLLEAINQISHSLTGGMSATSSPTWMRVSGSAYSSFTATIVPVQRPARAGCCC